MMRLLVMEIVLTTILVSVILKHGDGRRWQQTPGLRDRSGRTRRGNI